MGLKLLGPPESFGKTLQNFQFGGDLVSLPVARRSVGHVCNKKKSNVKKHSDADTASQVRLVCISANVNTRYASCPVGSPLGSGK